MKLEILLPLIFAYSPIHAWWGSSETYILYRTSDSKSIDKVRVAKFDGDGEEFNKFNCNTAAEFFAKQLIVPLKYFCVKEK